MTALLGKETELLNIESEDKKNYTSHLPAALLRQAGSTQGTQRLINNQILMHS